MWYVIQVVGGTEHKIKQKCEDKINKAILEQCFIPLYEEKIKQKGVWQIKHKILFPGYIFVVTKDVQALFIELKKVDGFTKLLGIGDDIVPLSKKEVKTIERLGGDKHIVKLSIGYIEGDKVTITSGALEGLETTIRKIDRHKRKAWIEIEMFNDIKLVEVGLEILWKK